jgi:RNA polymerase sigma-32 factor
MSAGRFDGQSELTRYFQAVAREEMMSAEQEAEVAREWLRTGRQRLADRLVNANLRFVIKIALEYRNYGFPLLDLIQEGNVGLVRAVKSYDPDKGYRLISYGVWWIRAFIQEYILKNWSLVKIGTTQLQRRLFNNLQSSQKRLQRLVEAGGQEEGSREALARSVGGTVADVEEMERRLAGRDLSLDLSYGDEGSSYSFHDRLADEGCDAESLLAEEQYRHVRNRELRRALEQLEERERFILVARRLQDDAVTLRELGDRLGISKERVRQLENRAVESLRNCLAKAYSANGALSV